MRDFELVLNKAGVNKLLKAPETRAMVQNFANQKAAAMGDGYKVNINYSSKDGRVTSYIYPDTDKAKQDNLDNNTVLKGVGG